MAINDLQTLIHQMSPSLDKHSYVFCTFSEGKSSSNPLFTQPAMPDFEGQLPFAMIQEAEGLTCIFTREAATALGLDGEPDFRRITLMVHSSLTAVGLTAAVSTALAQQGISANVVAAFHHDHIFVPSAQADTAMSILQTLAAGH
jgi:hypothetical protein